MLPSKLNTGEFPPSSPMDSPPISSYSFKERKYKKHIDDEFMSFLTTETPLSISQSAFFVAFMKYSFMFNDSKDLHSATSAFVQTLTSNQEHASKRLNQIPDSVINNTKDFAFYFGLFFSYIVTGNEQNIGKIIRTEPPDTVGNYDEDQILQFIMNELRSKYDEIFKKNSALLLDELEGFVMPLSSCSPDSAELFKNRFRKFIPNDANHEPSSRELTLKIAYEVQSLGPILSYAEVLKILYEIYSKISVMGIIITQY